MTFREVKERRRDAVAPERIEQVSHHHRVCQDWGTRGTDVTEQVVNHGSC